jgi:hypothetical protein
MIKYLVRKNFKYVIADTSIYVYAFHTILS